MPAEEENMEYRKMNSGYEIPALALGVWQSGDDTEAAVEAALKNGYRHIDTAAAYDNEEEVGKAIAKSGIPREDLFITTKLRNDDIRAGKTREALMESLKKLGLDYVDLYLIHWPVEGSSKAWQEMRKLRDEGYIRSIGVCNFKKHHLEELIEETGEVPAVDQMEFNPQMQDEEVEAFCKDNGIVLEAWSPLGHGSSLSSPVIAEIAQAHKKSPAQVILRWELNKGIVPLPKSVHENRIQENFDVFDFDLTQDEMAKLDALNEGKRTGPDPDNFDF